MPTVQELPTVHDEILPTVYNLPTVDDEELPTDDDFEIELPTVESVGKIKVLAEFELKPEWRYEWATRDSGGIQFCRRGDGKGVYYVGPRSKPDEWKIYAPAFREWVTSGKQRRKPTRGPKENKTADRDPGDVVDPEQVYENDRRETADDRRKWN